MFSDREQSIMRGMAAARATVPEIARALDRNPHNVWRWLRRHLVEVATSKRGSKPGTRKGVGVAERCALQPNEPGIVGEPPLKDDLAAADARWAKLFGAARTLAYTRRGGHAC